MPKPIDPNLQDRFDKLITQFNSADKDYENIRPFLHPQVVWKMLHHAETMTNADDLLSWLKIVKVPAQPQFIKKNHQPIINSDKSVMFTGQASWKSVQNSTDQEETIKYCFTFSKVNGNWLLQNVWGQVQS